MSATRIGSFSLSINVAAGTGYCDFNATGEIKRVIITKAGGPSASYVITDALGRGIAGQGPQTGTEINYQEDSTPCKGTNRFTIASNQDGAHLVEIYGRGQDGDWLYS